LWVCCKWWPMMLCLFIYYSCIPTKFYDVYSHPLLLLYLCVCNLGVHILRTRSSSCGTLRRWRQGFTSVVIIEWFYVVQKYVVRSVTLGLGLNVECLILWSLSLVKLYVIFQNKCWGSYSFIYEIFWSILRYWNTRHYLFI